MNDKTALTLERFAREQLGPGVTLDADPVARRPFARYNVVATFTDVAESRRALRDEEDGGTPAENISLLMIGGRPIADAEKPAEVGPDPEGVAGDTFRRVVPGALIGAVIGAVIAGGGALLVGSPNGVELAGAAVAGALMLAAVGGVVGAFAGYGDSDAFRQTFTDLRGGRALVAVYTDDADEAHTVERRLADAGERVWVLDAHGHRVRAGGRI